MELLKKMLGIKMLTGRKTFLQNSTKDWNLLLFHDLARVDVLMPHLLAFLRFKLPTRVYKIHFYTFAAYTIPLVQKFQKVHSKIQKFISGQMYVNMNKWMNWHMYSLKALGDRITIIEYKWYKLICFLVPTSSIENVEVIDQSKLSRL